MKPTQSHYNIAQRIYDRLGRGSVADIDAIAQALAGAERNERERCADIAAEFYAEDILSAPDVAEMIRNLIIDASTDEV